MNDWNYTKKAAKVGFLYGLSGVVYFLLLNYLVTSSSPYCTDMLCTEWGMLFTFIGAALYLPLFLLSYIISFYLSLSEDLLFFTLPFSGVVLFGILGFLQDLYNRKHQDDEKKNGKDEGIFKRISLGKEKSITLTEKAVNYCIIAGIILWASLFLLSTSGFTIGNEITGEYVKGGSSSHPFFFNNDNTFSERYPNGTTESGIYETDGSLLTLYYSSGRISEYYISGLELIPVGINQSDNEELRNKELLKVVIQ